MVPEGGTAVGAAYQSAAAGGNTRAPLGAAAVEQFRGRVYAHFLRHYRALAWRATRDPFAILVSEVMLQQTQVARVTRYYPRFLARFPDPAALARAPLRDVLEQWSGLGYNRRALALQRAAQVVARDYGGSIPDDRAALLQLPGIGPATAGALLAFAFERPVVFIETNIRRVYLDQFFPTATTVPDRALLPLVARTLDRHHPRRWYYALMDYGAALGRRGANPNRRSAHYTRQSTFTGSTRQLRGLVIRLLAARRCLTCRELRERCAASGLPTGSGERLAGVVAALVAERFLERRGPLVCIADAPEARC